MQQLINTKNQNVVGFVSIGP